MGGENWRLWGGWGASKGHKGVPVRIRTGDSERGDLRGLGTLGVRKKGRGWKNIRENEKTVRMETRGIGARDGQMKNCGGQNEEREQRATEEPRGGGKRTAAMRTGSRA